MRLGLTLLHLTKPIMPYRYRGKYRIVKKPSMHDLLKMKQDFEREERNMLILRYPYLTSEQANGHMSELRNGSRDFFEQIYAERRDKFFKQVTIAEHLDHLRVTEAWD